MDMRETLWRRLRSPKASQAGDAMREKDILKTIKRKVVLCDGGMGAMLIAAGLSKREVPESWNLSKPGKLIEIHTAFLEAGAEVIQTNTFGANRLKLQSSESGRALDVVEVNEKAVENARRAMNTFPAADRFLAGEIGPTGLFFPPVGQLTADEARKAFKEQALIFEKAGVDLFLVETMYDLREAIEALRAIRECSDRPVALEMTFEKKAKGYFTLVGDTPRGMVDVMTEEGADIIGANCTLSSDDMLDLVSEVRMLTDAPLLFQPNAGRPAMEHGMPVYRQRPEEFADDIEKMVRAGASAVGGCCGTTPDFIRAAHDRLTHNA
jgi:5-methyltetrahydrofolate--homocysteine methyltransferase